MSNRMQDHQYITDRWLPDMVKRLCADKGIAVKTFSDEWILTLEKDDIKRHVYGFKIGGMNDGAAVAISQDKVATYELLKGARIAAVPHALISTRANSYDDWEKQAQKWQRFVIKPTHGGGGRGVYVFDDIQAAQQLMATNHEQSWCVSPFVSIKDEVRVILLDDQVVLAFKKYDPVTIHEIPMFNLRLGARATKINPADDLIVMANAARRAVGLRLTAVDIVTLDTGEQLVLEVNEGFSLEHYMRQSLDHKQDAEKVYSAVIDVMMHN
jgi:glutathione synthase/RimK-type ligase-like ATP-grasp enzyme